MDERHRRCPNCRGEKFFVDRGGALTFVRVRFGGTVYASRPPHGAVELLEGEDLHCTGCGWHGGPDDLLPPADPCEDQRSKGGPWPGGRCDG